MEFYKRFSYGLN